MASLTRPKHEPAWIMVVLAVLLILAGMGWHIWTRPDWAHRG